MKNLLSPLSDDQKNSLDLALKAIKKALPIPKKHRQGLSDDIRELSSLLTEERSQLGRPYWASPALSSAYNYYFLPWNLYRMAWLLPALDMLLKADAKILDLGSGPLTLPMALWCSRPELRKIPLHFICTDMAKQPLDMGEKIFRCLDPESPWTFDLHRSTMETALSRAPQNLDLILSGNVLNELEAAKGSTLFQRINELIIKATQKLAPSAHYLLVEPGTRLGGKVISLARESALACLLDIEAPCTHARACPALEDLEKTGPSFNSWCHFNCHAQDAPAKLMQLTRESGFERQSLALSCLYLKNPANVSEKDRLELKHMAESEEMAELEAIYEEGLAKDMGSPLKNDEETKTPKKSGAKAVKPQRCPARIISGPIRIPGQKEAARYACSERGLLLISNSAFLPHGAAVMAFIPTSERRDRKSGALLAHIDKDSLPRNKSPRRSTKPRKDPRARKINKK